MSGDRVVTRDESRVIQDRRGQWMLMAVMAAEMSVMGMPRNTSGGSASSTRRRTPLKMTMASKKPRPAPRPATSAWG